MDSADKWGILITNGEFTAFVDPNFGTKVADSTQILVTESNNGNVQMSNTAFWGPSNNIAKVSNLKINRAAFMILFSGYIDFWWWYNFILSMCV